MAEPVIDDLTLRAYFASVIVGFRGPFGDKRTFPFQAAAPGRELALVENATRDKILSVVVTRSDVTGATNAAIFSKNSNGASTNDFGVLFAAPGRFNFVLKPGERLSLQNNGVNAMQVVTAVETY